MKIILDKGLATEAELPIKNFFEHISAHILNASNSFDISKGEVVPDLSDFIGRKNFQTIEIRNSDGVALPIMSVYDTIDDFNTSYFETDNIFTYNITFTKMNE